MNEGWDQCPGSPPSGDSHKLGIRLSLFSTRSVAATNHHRLLASTQLYCLVTQRHVMWTSCI